MRNLTISIFGSKIFYEIIIELKLFPKSEIKFVNNVNSFPNNDQIIFFFMNSENKNDFIKIKAIKNPIILITSSSASGAKYNDDLVEQISTPFKIINFKEKVISFLAKHEFKLSSLIRLNDYIIDKNERKIRKNNLELQLTERETDFLILFSKSHKPLSRDYFLKNVWKYSSESDTHTVETHIHRLRKKILDKFNDKNFIKNNNEGYYI
tara:strand:- start:275 stop:901 length:627 start_codon:yes stop_codon:yes gene_type:complete